ncbi:MAG: hypothetical protein JSR55_09995 [Proteobacteria bacterium]|nr:hypothetical protein [Pseudomonadota bacterium]
MVIGQNLSGEVHEFVLRRARWISFAPDQKAPEVIVHSMPRMILEREMQPFDQAVTAVVVAIFAVFSLAMGYATYLGTHDERHPSEKNKKKR